MKEKFNDYPIDRPLTAGRRQKIERFIKEYASRMDRPLSHRWDESGSVLHLESAPVEWEFVFYKNRVETFGSAPFWVKMLFTEKRRTAANEMILQLLEEAGFYDPEAEPDAEMAGGRKKRPTK